MDESAIMLRNISLFMDNSGRISVRRDLPIPVPDRNELLIKVTFSGINPADMKHGLLLGIRPAVLGFDFCGRVVENSREVAAAFRPDDVVAGNLPPGLGRPNRYGAHQSYCACPVSYGVFVVPKSMAFSAAAAFTTVVQTASDALFNQLQLPLPSTPTSPTEPVADGTLVIWGGSTSVGMAAIQLARAAGMKFVIATASPAQHNLLSQFGVTHCFDYSKAETVAAITAILAERPSSGTVFGFDAAGTLGNDVSCASGQLLAAAVSIGETHQHAAYISLSSVATQENLHFKKAAAVRHCDLTFAVPNVGLRKFLADPEAAARMWKGTQWAIDNYGTGFILPKIETFSGSAEDALELLQNAHLQGKFGKIALEHPLK